MANTTNSPQSAEEFGTGISWLYESNITSSDDTYAVGATDPDDSTKLLRAYNFGFSIPSDATIDGVEVNIERKQTTIYDSTDDEVRLYIGGSTGTENKAAETEWPSKI